MTQAYKQGSAALAIPRRSLQAGKLRVDVAVGASSDAAPALPLIEVDALTPLHKPDELLPALVQMGDVYFCEPSHLSGALYSCRPLLGRSAIRFTTGSLGARSEAPHSPQGTC
jgi:hypothetical protein